MLPVSTITTSLLWIANADGYFSVHPLPRSALSGRLKVSRNTPLGSSTEKYWTLAVPPPGAGLKTVTCTVPVTLRSVAGIAAVSWVADPNVVVRSVPFQRTTEPGTNPVPVTIRVNPGDPAMTDAGTSPDVAGVGLPPPVRLVRVKLSNV